MSASPILKRNKKKVQVKARKTQESDMIEERKPVNVNMISKYFEECQKTNVMTQDVPYTGNAGNNNTVYTATAVQLLAGTSTGPDPEMAVPSVTTAQPMTSEDMRLSGHVTKEKPIRGEKKSLGQIVRERSHFE